jgi:hypothetical protein
MNWPDWLTVDRAIAIIAGVGSPFAAAFAFLGYRLSVRERRLRETSKLPQILLSVSPHSGDNGWHLASIQRRLDQRLDYELIEPKATWGFELAPGMKNPNRLGTYWVVNTVAQAQKVVPVTDDWWLPGELSVSHFSFGIRRSSIFRSRKYRSVSLRLIVEERSPARRRIAMPIRSNATDWQTKAASKSR